MKTLAAVLALCLFIGSGFAQQSSTPPDFTVKQLNFSVINPPQAVSFGSAVNSNNPGPATYYYWVVTNDLAGSSTPAGPFVISNGPNTISSTAGVNVSWRGVSSGITYDVLRTSTSGMPVGSCNCAVATAVTGTSVTDQSSSLSAYTVAPFNPASKLISVSNVNGVLIFNGAVFFNTSLGFASITTGSVNGTINVGSGCAGDGATDDTSCLNANLASAGATGCVRFPSKTFATTGTVHITTQCVKNDGATILYSGTGAALDVTITYPSTNGCELSLPTIDRPARLWSSGSPSTDSGILFLDANGCRNISIPRIHHFTNGLDLSPSAFGVARNVFWLGDLNDNMRGLRFAPTTLNGFANQNTFIGGYWSNDTSLGWAVPGTRDILFAASTDQVTSNLFFSSDLEGQVSEYMVESWGEDNKILNGEWENPIARTVTDATVTSGSATITLTGIDVTAGKGFNANADVGQTVTGGLFPASTTILSVTSSTVATASANATSSGNTLSISSAPRVAYRNSGGNTAQRNVIEGGFASSGIVATKDAGVITNTIINFGQFGNHYAVLDGGSATYGRGSAQGFGSTTLGYGTATPQFSVEPTSSANGDNQTEGSVGAGVTDGVKNFMCKMFYDNNAVVAGTFCNGNSLGVPYVISEGNQELARFDPTGNKVITFGGASPPFTFDFVAGFSTTKPIVTGTGGTSQVDRIRFNKATAQTSGNIALSAGWGNTASVSSVLGTDNALALIVSSSGTGQAASPTITITYADGSWTNSPICVAGAAAGNTAIATGINISSANTTQVVIQFAGFTPVAASTYGVNLTCSGR